MTMTPLTPCLIETTTATLEDAERIANHLLERKLAACVQCETVRSRYLWQGRIADDPEIRLSIKSAAHLYPQIEAEITARHPYDCPQILMLPISAMSPDYLAWLTESLTP